MAYRAVVKKSQTIRALASSMNISVVDAQLEKTAAVISVRSYDASVTARVMKAIANYSNAATQIHYRKLLATDLALDPYSLNRYFRLDQFGISDTQAFFVTKAFNDLVQAADQTDLQFSKGLSDSFGMGDDSIFLEMFKEFVDSTSVIDTQAFSLGVSKSEVLEIADIAAMLTAKFLSDVIDISEQAIFDISKSSTEFTSLSDQLLKNSIFQRSFSDGFVLDDFTDVNAITKDSTAAKTNVIGFSDVQSFGTEKTLQDSAALSELAALSIERTASDSLSVGDVFQKATTFNRAVSDSTLLSDSSHVAIGKELSDTTPMSEVFARDVIYNRTFSDAVIFSEQSVAAFEKGLSDTASITEALQVTTASLVSSVLNASALNSGQLNN